MPTPRPSRARPLDPDAITRYQAAELIGVSESRVNIWRREGLLTTTMHGKRRVFSRAQAEELAENPWITTTHVAEILGVSRSRVAQLVNVGKLPAFTLSTGVKMYRLQQIEVIANARWARRFRRKDFSPPD